MISNMLVCSFVSVLNLFVSLTLHKDNEKSIFCKHLLHSKITAFDKLVCLSKTAIKKVHL